MSSRRKRQSHESRFVGRTSHIHYPALTYGPNKTSETLLIGTLKQRDERIAREPRKHGTINSGPYLCSILTDLQLFFADKLRAKFATE